MRIAVVNAKGGTGKTLTAVHLAAALAERDRTLLIDADPQQSALSWSEKASGDFPCPVVALPVRDLHRRLEELANGFVNVVIDTPPGDLAIIRGAVLAADQVVVPLPPTAVDIDRLQATLELVAEVESFHPVSLHILVTRVRAGTRLSKDIRTVLDELEAPVLVAQIPLREAYAASFGAPPAPQVDYSAVLEEISS